MSDQTVSEAVPAAPAAAAKVSHLYMYLSALYMYMVPAT